VTFDENAGKTLLVVHDLYPSKEALDSGSTDAMPEALDQLDELLASLGSVRRHNDAANPSTNASGRVSSAEHSFPFNDARYGLRVGAAEANDGLRASQWKSTCYYEVHGSGAPVVLLHGAFMTITNNWDGWIGELSKRGESLPSKCRATAHGGRPTRYHLRKPRRRRAALLNYLKIRERDLIGYSMAEPWRCSVRSESATKCEGSHHFRPRSAVTA